MNEKMPLSVTMLRGISKSRLKIEDMKTRADVAANNGQRETADILRDAASEMESALIPFIVQYNTQLDEDVAAGLVDRERIAEMAATIVEESEEQTIRM